MRKLKKIDCMILGTFLSSLFYASSYPRIHKFLVESINDDLLAVSQIATCLSIMIFGKIWNDNSKKIFKFYPIICVSEVIANVVTIIWFIFNPNITLYYIIDTIIISTLSRNIICGYNKLLALRYRGVDDREKFGNNANSAYALATIIGSFIAMVLNFDLIPMLFIATFGNCMDNIFYIYAFYHTDKTEEK